jgi:hypothetical protein
MLKDQKCHLMNYQELSLVEIKYIMFLFYFAKYMDKEKELINKNIKILNSAIILFNEQLNDTPHTDQNGGTTMNNNLLINSNNIINLGVIQLDKNTSFINVKNSNMTLKDAKNNCLHRFFNSKKN